MHARMWAGPSLDPKLWTTQHVQPGVLRCSLLFMCAEDLSFTTTVVDPTSPLRRNTVLNACLAATNGSCEASFSLLDIGIPVPLTVEAAMGNGKCEKKCNVSACAFDGGDCLAPVVRAATWLAVIVACALCCTRCCCSCLCLEEPQWWARESSSIWGMAFAAC